MASVSRQTIDQALFGVLKDNLPPSVKTVSRKLKGWDDVPASQQPAVFLVKRTEYVERKRGFPSKVLAKFDIVVYVHTGGVSSVVPADMLNPILDSVCAAFEPNDGQYIQTLGLPETVSHAAINGEILTDEGVLGDQAFAVIPVEVLWI